MTADEELLHRLAVIARASDPVPATVTTLARAAFTLRRLDEEYAALVSDSDVELVGVRGAGTDARLLTFASAELVVEAQVSAAGRRCTVLGQVAAPSAPGGSVRLELPSHRGEAVALDALGGFRFDDVPPGTVRLTVELPGVRTVSTAWFSL